jgi:hypothetical protein
VSQNEKKTRVLSLVLPILLLGLADHGATAQEQSGRFSQTGSMTTPRRDHTATLLTNGKVLLAGGARDDSTFASAELYDASTGTFIATGNMSLARWGQTATLLPDGRVLIAGGSDLASSELYDPATGIFTATGSMSTPRTGHTATLLADGRVLIAGGSYWNGSTYDILSAELYDASTGIFTATGSMHHAWIEPTATLLSDGRVLIAGADQGGAGGELYSPSTGMFTGDGYQTDAFDYNASLLMDGTVLISGGGNSDPGYSLADAELYDARAGTFAATGRMEACRFWHSSTLLPDGTVLIAGGDGRYCSATNQGFSSLANAELYVPSGKVFAATGNMTRARQNHTATLLNDGTVLIAGGTDFGNSAIAYEFPIRAELYQPALLIAGPKLFSHSGEGEGQGLIWHGDTGQIVSPDNPAVPGEVLSMYATGLVHGSVIPPQVAVGSRLAEILYFGDAPGYPGYGQVNFRVPNSAASGPSVAVRLTYLGRPSNAVTIGVR